MIHCGSYYNNWIEHALKYLPKEVFAQVEKKLAIFATAQLDACRISRAVCEEREIILLSERVLPKRGAEEDYPDVRYFIFVVLHEIAHAFKNHRCTLYDNISEKECSAQEEEADNLAFLWFNEHVRGRNNPYLQPLTHKEIEESKEKNQKLMNDLYEGQGVQSD
jgi:hypothetical protein